MKNSHVSNFRVVRCPKCAKLLREPDDVPVYICGGCNTALEAKYYKANERRNAFSEGSDSVQINEDDSVNEPGHLKVEKPSKLVTNTGQVQGDQVSANSSSEDASSETTSTKTGEIELSNQAAGELSQIDVKNCRLEQDEVSSSLSEVLSSSETSQHKTKLGDSSFKSELTLSDESTVGVKKLTSQLGSPAVEVVTRDQNIPSYHNKEQPGFGMKYESEVSSRDEHVVIDSSSSQVLRSNQEGEGAKRDEATLQNDLGKCEDNRISGNLPSETNSSYRINSRETNQSALAVRVAEAGSDLLYKAKGSTASSQDGKRESEQSFEADAPADGNNRAKIVEIGKTDDCFESTASSKVTETTIVNSDLHVSCSHGDLSKSPTRSSFAYDGSVSSCDGNGDKAVDPIASETMQGRSEAENPVAEDKRQRHPSVTNTTYGASTLQRETDDLQTVSGSDSFHSAAQSIPAVLDEIRHGSHRRTRTRPRTGQVLPNTPLYRRSPETSYESSTRASLIHEEIYDYPVHYPPYSSRDTRRYLHGSDRDGRVFADTVWMKEELPACPYHESNERHQMCCQGARPPAYYPLPHSMAQIPYSGGTVESAYRVHDPRFRVHPVYERWSSDLPYPGAYYHRGLYNPREPVDSYTDYTSSEDQRQRDQDKSRLQSRRKSQHFQPIGGAAPFITCYKCSELLQLPSDFLLFKGIRLHRVKCSACSSVLKLRLEKGRHLVPYSSESTEKHDDNRNMEYRRCASASAYNGASHDTEKTSLRSSSTSHCQDKGKSIMAARNSPPLHQLMGYSSVSAALQGPRDTQA